MKSVFEYKYIKYYVKIKCLEMKYYRVVTPMAIP